MVRGPSQSRVDLVAAVSGVVHVRIAELERLDRIDPLEVFTIFDGQIVSPGDLVASVKVAPHLVEADLVEAGVRLADGGRRPLVWVAAFEPRKIGVVVKESIRGTARERFETSVRAKIGGLGSEIVAIEYVEDSVGAVEAAMSRFVRGADRVDLDPHRGSREHRPAGPVLRRDRLARRACRAAGRAGAPRIHALAGAHRPDGDPRAADMWRVLEGDGRGPAAASAVVRRPGVSADRREAGPRRHPHPVAAVPVPALRSRARRAGRVGERARLGLSRRGARC